MMDKTGCQVCLVKKEARAKQAFLVVKVIRVSQAFPAFKDRRVMLAMEHPDCRAFPV